MAYDEGLAQRVKNVLVEKPEMAEKKMFGGVCYLINGNMACGILNQDLIVRVGPEKYDAFLDLPHVREFDITGKVMRGWVMVSSQGHASPQDLSRWIQEGLNYALRLPPKKPKQ